MALTELGLLNDPPAALTARSSSTKMCGRNFCWRTTKRYDGVGGQRNSNQHRPPHPLLSLRNAFPLPRPTLPSVPSQDDAPAAGGAGPSTSEWPGDGDLPLPGTEGQFSNYSLEDIINNKRPRAGTVSSVCSEDMRHLLASGGAYATHSLSALAPPGRFPPTCPLASATTQRSQCAATALRR